ncbi:MULTISPECIES: hypothetical protein [unclassified Pseudarthrobacter]|uniref:hypothetical protein n=1 Tax=unclassified Pseudarthrobacter TaxID=2647000 RepID=UPI0030785ACC
MTITFEWRGMVRNDEINQLHAEGFDHALVEVDWTDVLSRLSLGWVTARDDLGLVGFVNVLLRCMRFPSHQCRSNPTALASGGEP